MSLIKKYLQDFNEANSVEKCPDCKPNYDDHFYEYCPKHLAEMEQLTAEREREWQNTFILGVGFAAKS